MPVERSRPKAKSKLQFWSLPGLVSYEKARELQLALVEKRAEGKIPDTILFLEHEPVVTRGRGLQFTGVPRARHMPMVQALPPGVSFAESERGGDLTFHGPGQLVMYPIVHLGDQEDQREDGQDQERQGFSSKRDIGGFLRKLENIFIVTLKEYGLQAGTRENATGIWIKDRKIASIGIAVRKWITYHGVALNCVNDLKPFHLISPCGFNPEVMTRLCDWVPDLGQDWRSKIETSIVQATQATASASGIAPLLTTPQTIEELEKLLASGRVVIKNT